VRETEDGPRDEVRSIVATASRIERACGHRPREARVRDDAFVAWSKVHSTLPGGTVATGLERVNN
jgi:hypothetical protein